MKYQLIETGNNPDGYNYAIRRKAHWYSPWRYIWPTDRFDKTSTKYKWTKELNCKYTLEKVTEVYNQLISGFEENQVKNQVKIQTYTKVISTNTIGQ